jgi:ArsR family transcriptional regulator
MSQQIQKDADVQASFCSVFSNPSRIEIVWTLGEREMSVSEIANEARISVANASQHLRLMKDRGVLTSRRDGHTVYYRIASHLLTEPCLVFCRMRESN